MGLHVNRSPAVEWSGGAAYSAADVNGLTAGSGYRLRTSDLPNAAHHLEQFDAATDTATAANLLPSDAAVHFTASDLTAWVDSMLTDTQPPPPHAPPPPDTWLPPLYFPQTTIPTALRTAEDEENCGIRLIHLLMSSAHAVHRGDDSLARSLIVDTAPLLTSIATASSIGKVAAYFFDALCRRLYSPHFVLPPFQAENDVLHHQFYESCPYLKFAHFTANQAILEAFNGEDAVHVIDFNLMQGLQWPALIQALALRPGGPPILRLTGIGPPSPDGRDNLREVGLRLARLARSVNVRFAFRGVAAARLEDVRPWMLQASAGEAVAVNSILQLHRLLSDAAMPAPIDSVLPWIVGLRPKIVTVVEQEVDHNKPVFLDRFTEALFYYSTLFDSIEGRGTAPAAAAAAEVYLQREMCNVVCCEGAARVERHEPLSRWRDRMSRAGLRPVHLGSNAFKQASMLLTLFSGEGYCIEEVEGCLTMGWHSRPLFSASAWSGCDDVPSSASSDVFDFPNGGDDVNDDNDKAL